MSAAVCTDCHNSHDILPASNPLSSIAKTKIPSTCGKCHQGESSEFIQSIHGQAVLRGVSRAPVCTDCHDITGRKQAEARVLEQAAELQRATQLSFVGELAAGLAHG